MSKMGSVQITLDDFNQRLEWAVQEIQSYRTRLHELEQNTTKYGRADHGTIPTRLNDLSRRIRELEQDNAEVIEATRGVPQLADCAEITDLHRRLNDTNKALDAVNARLDDEVALRFEAVSSHTQNHDARLIALEDEQHDLRAELYTHDEDVIVFDPNTGETWDVDELDGPFDNNGTTQWNLPDNRAKPVTGNGQAMNNPPYSDWAYDPATGRIIDTTAPVTIDIDPPHTSEHRYYPKAQK